MDSIDIPELQLIAITVTGFVVGGFFLPLWQKSPVLFTLASTLLFFFVRFVPAYFELDSSGGGATIPGNGIISAAIMYVVYIAMMQLGYTVLHWKFGPLNEEGP